MGLTERPRRGYEAALSESESLSPGGSQALVSGLEVTAMRSAAAVLIALTVGIAPGCVERRMVIASDPPGALVLHNHKPIGNSPADDHFVYYGIHHFTLIRPGYQ